MRRLLTALTLALAATSAGAMCPIEPIAPIGCRAVCVCDDSGMNCRYIFLCK